MDHTLKLPDELLLQIFGYLPNHPRPTDVALTCHRFHDCVKERLWSSVHLHYKHLSPHVKALSQVLRRSPALCPLIKCVDVHSLACKEIADSNCIEELIGQLLNTRELSINTWTANWKMLKLSNLHTLNLYAPLLKFAIDRPESIDPVNSWGAVVRSLVCMPSLQRLRIEEAELSNRALRRHPEHHYFRPSDEVTSLSIKDFSWINLYCDLQTIIPILDRLDQPERIALNTHKWTPYEGALLSRALHMHQNSLQELVIYPGFFKAQENARLLTILPTRNGNDGLSVDLLRFPNLKRLGLSLLYDSIDDNDLLPSQLEIIQFAHWPKSKPYCDERWRKYLNTILNACGGHLSKLRKLIFWCPFLRRDEWPSGLIETMEVLWEMFKETNVELELSLAKEYEETPLSRSCQVFDRGIVDLQGRSIERRR